MFYIDYVYRLPFLEIYVLPLFSPRHRKAFPSNYPLKEHDTKSPQRDGYRGCCSLVSLIAISLSRTPKSQCHVFKKLTVNPGAICLDAMKRARQGRWLLIPF